tara:strand:- start:5768 stop:6595 length:828 start_codon:yes stop_codon:yes gene_type:complete
MKDLISDNPLVSIILSIYKPDLELLRRSINSLLNQTYSNIEIVLIEDGLVSLEKEFIRNLTADCRNIKFIRNDSNLGLTKSLNKGIKKAKGELIARQDADDISYPSRIEKQVKKFQENEELGLLGTWYIVNDSENQIIKKPVGNNKELIDMMFRRNPFCHSSVMIKKSCLHQSGIYDERFETTQDLDLWFRIAKKFNLGILEEVLVERNLSEFSLSYGNKRWIQLFNSLKIRLSARKMFSHLNFPIYKTLLSFFIGFLISLSPKFSSYLQKMYKG